MTEEALIYERAKQLFSYSQNLRRDFHRFPELGYQEHRTAEIIARELSNLGFEVQTSIAETGVVGLLEGKLAGPVILLRFDMDALPILEETNKSYASENPGVMHACGHDGHMAVGLTAARLLQEQKDTLRGIFKFVFQPAEEGLGGAERMIREGVLENPSVDYSLALHLWNEKPLGWIAATPGTMMAGADFFTIKIKGKGGHGAMPDTTIDPIMAATQVVSGLQTIVSRNIGPLDTAVVSVTQITAGTAHNIIPSEAELRGTIRTFDSQLRHKVVDRFNDIVTQLAAGMGCNVEIDIQQLTPALINNPDVAAEVQKTVYQLFPDYEVDTQYRSMGSEDMAFFLNQSPGCLFFVGSANVEMGLIYSHHHPKFDFDEDVLPVAAAIIAGAAVRLTDHKE